MTITKAITQASERKNGLSSQLGFVLICNAELMQMTVNAPRLSNLSVRMSTVERPKTPSATATTVGATTTTITKPNNLSLALAMLSSF